MRKLIAGTSLSGKTTLAKELARLHRAAGRSLLVLDEMMDPGWKPNAQDTGIIVTDDPKFFRDVFWSSRNLTVFMDEAGESVGRYDAEMRMVATKGRHWGHISHFIVQDPTQVSRVIRSQCDEAFIFALDERGAEILAAEFRCKEILKSAEMGQGEYLRVLKFGPDRRPSYQHGKIF